MSAEAISWALNLALVPADRGGQPSIACKFVLVGLANRAGPVGKGARAVERPAACGSLIVPGLAPFISGRGRLHRPPAGDAPRPG